MKKIIFITLVLTLAAPSLCQQVKPSPALTKEVYLKKRFKQNTAAHALLWCGFAAVITGGSIEINQHPLFSFANEQKSHPGNIVATIGGVAMLGSIPLFILAAINKRKAMSMSFKNESAPQIQKTGFVYRAVPSLTLKINL